MNVVRRDFDRIARLPEERWHIDDDYVRKLLNHIPAGCGAALEIGCGTGRVTRRLAQRCAKVLALDSAPGMIEVARQRSRELTQVRFRACDVETFECAPDSFDAIVSVATLHHLALERSLERMRRWLAPGGTLLVLDLAYPEGPWRLPRRAVAFALSRLLYVRHNRALRRPAAVRAAWAEHARHDHFHALTTIRRAARELLPGAHLRPHLFWRYTLTWTKPHP